MLIEELLEAARLPKCHRGVVAIVTVKNLLLGFWAKEGRQESIAAEVGNFLQCHGACTLKSKMDTTSLLVIIFWLTSRQSYCKGTCRVSEQRQS